MTKQELEDWFKQTAKIIGDLHISLNNAKRLYEDKYENEEWIKNHGFFRHHLYQLWFIMSVQIPKLLQKDKHQKYNFILLLERLEKEELDENIIGGFGKSKNPFNTSLFQDREDMLAKIKQLQTEIKSHKKIINRFIVSRNTLYAHRDHNAKTQDLNLEDAENLVKLCKKIYNSLRGGFFDIYFHFDRTTDWNIDFILKQASLARTKRLTEK